jgi:hypothetical protein
VTIDFQVKRDELHECRFVRSPDGEVRERGDVLLAIDRFAFTSNNITYAVAGDMLDYWGFFPDEGRWGRIVLEGRHAPSDGHILSLK